MFLSGPLPKKECRCIDVTILVLMADPNWNRGFYYDGVPPHNGMKLARRKLCHLETGGVIGLGCV